MLEIDRVVTLSLEGLVIESVLDIGTGTGLFAEAFCKLPLYVVGIDPNRSLLGSAREYVPGAAFLEAKAENIPFANDSFDLVILAHVLHEADMPVVALQEARRVVRTRVSVLEWPYKQEEHGPPLEHRLAPDAIEKLAKNADFKSIERISLRHMELYRLMR